MKPLPINLVGSRVHCSGRHGRFSVSVKSETDEWLTGTIIGGRAKFMTQPDKVKGDKITIRKCLYLLRVLE